MRSILLVCFVALCGCKHQDEAPKLGADRDEHGCIGSAGYTWNEEKGKCVRPWLED